MKTKKITNSTAAGKNFGRENPAGILNGLSPFRRRISDKIADEIGIRNFLHAIEDASDHIVLTNPDAVVLYANKAASIMTGYSFNEMLGSKPSLWGRQMSRLFYKELWKKIKKEKQPFTGEIVNRRKSGEKYFAEIKISPITNHLTGEIEFYTGIERDITREKEIERSKNEFISVASHQLITPLASIGLAAEMMIAGYAGKINREQKKYLKNIHESIMEMAEKIEFLMDVSRIEMGMMTIKPEPTDVNKFMDSLLKEFYSQIAAKNIRLRKKYDKKISKINMDRKLMRLALENLVSNAVKYNKAGGSISVETKKHGDDIVFKISDTGCGIPKNQEEKLFSKFFRSDNSMKDRVKGTGLGLYIVKKSAEECGGKIRFKTKENKGTAFYLSIPAAGMKKTKKRTNEA